MRHISFSLRTVLLAVSAIGLLLGACRLMSLVDLGGLSILLVSSAVAWHFIEDDWQCLAITAACGAVMMYLVLLTAATAFKDGLGPFPTGTFLFATPSGLFIGRNAMDRISAGRWGRNGWRGFVNWLFGGSLILVVCLVVLRLWHGVNPK
jgi:hypothetical protein